MYQRRRSGSLALAGLLLVGGCQRLADEPEVYDFEALKVDACEDVCRTIDTCDPDAFTGMEPEDCFERCMTLLPKLHEENQCGSRELNYLWCVGGLTCEGYAAFNEANSQVGPDYTVPCVAEIRASCSTEAPFDLDEPLPPYP